MKRRAWLLFLVILCSCGRGSEHEVGSTGPSSGDAGNAGIAAGGATAAGAAGSSAQAGTGMQTAGSGGVGGGGGAVATPWLPSKLIGDFAFDAMWTGDVDRTGIANPDAWQLFGRDIDGSENGKPLCNVLPGVPVVQGPHGEDNRIGQRLPDLTVATTESQTMAIHAGRYSILVHFDGPEGTLAEAAPATTAPAFEGKDSWSSWSDSGPGPGPGATGWTTVEMQDSTVRARGAGPFRIHLYGEDTSMPDLVVVGTDLELSATLSADGEHLGVGTLSGVTGPGNLFPKSILCESTGAPFPFELCDLGKPGELCGNVSFGFAFTAVRYLPAPPVSSPAACW